MTAFVDLSFEGPCAHLTLKRPDKLNALDRPMIDAFLDGARAIEASPEARVAILSGEGKAFCAGGDIAAWGGLQPLEMWRDWTRAGHRAFEALARLRVPLIVVLTGHAFGGGLELAAVGDIRIAESGIKLGLPESGLGMAPGWSGTQRLVRRFGASVVRRMALTGAIFPAEEGLPLGLVDEVVAKGEGLTRASALAADIAKRGPLAVQMVKAMINAAEGEDRDAPIEGLAGAFTAFTISAAMMPSSEATVMTATSLCATCDISCARTPSSSWSSSLSRIPRVAQMIATLLLRPVANAFGMLVGAMATRGLGMLASAQMRSTISCSLRASGESSGLTSLAPEVRSAILSDQ